MLRLKLNFIVFNHLIILDVAFMETSAYKAINIDKAFQLMINGILYIYLSLRNIYEIP
jgi:hypothetical protein